MDTPNNINNLQIMCPLFRGSAVKGNRIALPVFFSGCIPVQQEPSLAVH